MKEWTGWGTKKRIQQTLKETLRKMTKLQYKSRLTFY